MRLNAYLASCGVASRRKAEKLILAGRVRVNGKIILAPYFQVVPEEDEILYGGRKLHLCRPVYLVMNKPTGVVCAVSDKHDPVVVDLLPESFRHAGVFPAGRLDRESEGLLVLTNDGTFAHSILHPSKGVLKEYEILLNMEIHEKQLARWRRGFELDTGSGGKKRNVKPLLLERLLLEPQGRWLRIVIGEGLKREVRTMAQLAGFSVKTLIRRRIGKMSLKNLSPGQFLELSFSQLYFKIFNGGSV
ncbi:MAG: rRNA pseudouridine synthase [Fretibacterium sp.]|nr:rRNA pseudouridine synthase [Fretibacterium sp.]